MRKPWRRKKNLIFSAVSGADATEHFSVFVIEGNEIDQRERRMWRMVKIKHEFVSSSREGVLYVSIPYATAVHNAVADAA